jgi:hypothetical protein
MESADSSRGLIVISERGDLPGLHQADARRSDTTVNG